MKYEHMARISDLQVPEVCLEQFCTTDRAGTGSKLVGSVQFGSAISVLKIFNTN